MWDMRGKCQSLCHPTRALEGGTSMGNGKGQEEQWVRVLAARKRTLVRISHPPKNDARCAWLSVRHLLRLRGKSCYESESW